MTTKGPRPAVLRMLVATDLSARADRAIERAVALAGPTGAALTILHVVDADLPVQMADRLAAEARTLIAEHVASVRGGDAAAPEIKVVFGRDHRDIADVVEKAGAGLIVLGMHRNETPELFRGSTAERLIRGGPCPVLMVKTKPLRAYRRVVVGVDFSECSRRALEFAVGFLPDCEFHLVHAFDVPFKAFLSGDEIQREASKDHQEQMDRFVGEDFSAFRAATQGTPARFFQIVRQGPVRQVIQEQAERLKADLLVVGTHGRGGLAHALLGSIAEDLLSRPPCDVLAVHA